MELPKEIKERGAQIMREHLYEMTPDQYESHANGIIEDVREALDIGPDVVEDDVLFIRLMEAISDPSTKSVLCRKENEKVFAIVHTHDFARELLELAMRHDTPLTISPVFSPEVIDMLRNG